MKLPDKEIRVPKKKSYNVVYGFGINDADYQVVVRDNDVVIWRCPIYEVWAGMLRRCYSEKFHLKRPTYKGCTVCEDWLIFSKFREWMLSQDWIDKDLDKDLLCTGNKVYSPDTCIFVHPLLNSFITDSASIRGECMIGVSWHKRIKKFQSRCRNPFINKEEHLGYFVDELEAHLAWKSRKHELACQLADSDYCNDPRLAEVLRNRYK